MTRTTLLTLAALAGWAATAAAQTPGPDGTPKATSAAEQVQQRTETQSHAEVQQQETTGAAPVAQGARFVDADGDGICDNCQGQGRGAGQGSGTVGGRRGRGPGNGSGNQGVGPRDGSGFGAGSGNCDGTGPKGRGNRGGRR